MLNTFAEKLGIPVDRLKIFKKSYTGMSTYCELVNQTSQLEKQLSYVGIYDGSTLFVEEVDTLSNKAKWQQQFELESRRCTIKFNNPYDKPNEYKFLECNHSVVLEFESTIQTLRDTIARKLKIPNDCFIMKRGGAASMELKDPNLKLIQANLSNYSLVYVELGVPTGANQHRIVFSLGNLSKNAGKDCNCYDFYDLFDLPIEDSMKIGELKVFLIEKLKEMYPTISLDISRVRIRERNGERLSKIMLDGDSMNFYIMYDRKNLCLETIDSPDSPEITSSDIIVLAKRWWPSTWNISECKEIIIKKYASINEFGKQISSLFDIPVIPT